MPRPPHRLLAALGTDEAGPTDADLLARFSTQRDAGAFELLVYRHAPLVLRVCRTALRDRHAAEDAAQAVFLALARQAGAVPRGDPTRVAVPRQPADCRAGRATTATTGCRRGP